MNQQEIEGYDLPTVLIHQHQRLATALVENMDHWAPQ